ncbi:hypothetical protein S40288_05772 [Stachybotrys chartarum IBT 40288]|nr:hypothetical protein S40288_05772 [Stachybotrys chartarum IBT 40288]
MAVVLSPSRPWRQAVLGFAAWALGSFTINLSFTLYAMISKWDSLDQGIGVLAEQDCSQTELLNTVLHIIINVLSAALLAGSNYCMQCIIAPTRSQVDVAHEKKRWLDIGVPGFRNYPSITWTSKWIWMLLCLSSLPIHFLYNSTIFATTSINHYLILVAHEAEESYLGGLAGAAKYVSGPPLKAEDYRWLCYNPHRYSYEFDCDKTMSNINAGRPQTIWQMGISTSDIRHAYSSTTPERCKLRFSLPFCWVVTGLNLMKGLLMIYILIGDFDEPLLTIGDPISSFLEVPDPFTKSMSLCDKEYFRSFVLDGLFGRALNRNLAEYDFGDPHADTMLEATLGSGPSSLLTSVLLANFPQVVLSILYVIYNALFTSLSVASEWNSYGYRKKGLRVSTGAKGDQRESYFLQLPYKISLPLISLSGILHWLISQSLFIIALEEYDIKPGRLLAMETRGALSLITVGWSPLGSVIILVISAAAILFLLVVGCVPLRRTGMPIAGNCSAAIAAACHPGREEPHSWEMPLQWGVVQPKVDDIGHCSFSTLDVRPPEPDHAYM